MTVDPDGTLDLTSVTIVGSPNHGVTNVNPTTGAITYTPALNYTGPDSFMYKVRDNLGIDSNVATVSITVNAPPVANNDSATTNKNTAVVVNVLSNDSDPDGTINPTTVTIVGEAQPRHDQRESHDRRDHVHARGELHRPRQLHLQGKGQSGRRLERGHRFDYGRRLGTVARNDGIDRFLGEFERSGAHQ